LKVGDEAYMRCYTKTHKAFQLILLLGASKIVCVFHADAEEKEKTDRICIISMSKVKLRVFGESAQGFP